MAVVDVLMYPNPILRQKSVEIVEFDKNLSQLTNDMIETMRRHKGIGIAAPQIGVLQRVIVVSFEKTTYVLSNPVILSEFGDRIVEEEGCLSLPGVQVDVERHDKIKVKAHSLNGEEMILEESGMISRIIQHEVDHLEGVLITDKGIAK